MTLYYIYLGLDYDEYIVSDNKLRYGFQLNTSFINHYLSKKIRKVKFKTDNTYKMISIHLSETKNKSAKIVAADVLQVTLPFDRNEYLKIKGSSNFDFYLKLFEEGFQVASDFKNIPYQELMCFLEDFKKMQCKNTWIDFKKKFKDDDIEIILKSDFTTNYYEACLTVNQISLKKELVSGTILRTEPDDIIFSHLFKTVEVNSDIFIKNKFDDPIIRISKNHIFKGKLNFELLSK